MAEGPTVRGSGVGGGLEVDQSCAGLCWIVLWCAVVCCGGVCAALC